MIQEVPLRFTDARAGTPAGLSFDIPDLLIVQAWAEFHGLSLRIQVDATGGDGAYEEVMHLGDACNAERRWLVWRSVRGIVAERDCGAAKRFETTTDALDWFLPACD